MLAEGDREGGGENDEGGVIGYFETVSSFLCRLSGKKC